MIGKILKTPDYHQRATRLAFVQSSDFHGRAQQTIGQRRTWVRLDKVKLEPVEVFQALRRVLRNPDEYVSAPGRPEVQEIRRRLDERNTPSVRGIDDPDDVEKLIQYSCAFANSGDGTVIVGRTDRGNWIGIESDSGESLGNRVSSLIDNNIKLLNKLRIEVYQYYGNRFFITLRVRKQNRLCATDGGKVFTIEQGKPYQSTIQQIVELAEEKLIERYATLSITTQVNRLAHKLSGIQDSIDILPITRKIERLCIPSVQLLNLTCYL